MEMTEIFPLPLLTLFPLSNFGEVIQKVQRNFLKYPIIQAMKREIQETAQRDCSIWYVTAGRCLWAIIVVLVVKTVLIMIINLQSRITIERQQHQKLPLLLY